MVGFWGREQEASPKMKAELQLAVAFAVSSAAFLGGTLSAADGKVEITVADKDTQQPIPVRMHLKDQRGKPVLPPRTVSWDDHFVFDGSLNLKLRPGKFTFEVERGPEYRVRTGEFEIRRGADDAHAMVLERFVDMKREGWWSGELHIHRRLQDIELLMQAEDLHVAPVITWWNDKDQWSDQPLPEDLVQAFDGNRFYHRMAGEDEREGGALLYFNLPKPLPLSGSAREFPSPVKFLEMARANDGVHVDVEKPFWWDMPVWVATKKIDSIGLAHNHLWRSGVLDNEAWGKPRDMAEYPSPHGNGRWSQDIYYQLLNCGLRIPPSAGSASGVLRNPVGYNRVYVFCGEELTYERWWEGLRAGRVVVTNGPLLRPLVNGKLPGHVFAADQGETIELNISLEFSTRDKIERLEIVCNGRVEHAVRTSRIRRARGATADAHVPGKWLDVDPRSHQQRADVSLRVDRTILRGDRARAANQQEVGAVLSRLGVRAGQANPPGGFGAATGGAAVPSSSARLLAETRRGRQRRVRECTHLAPRDGIEN